MALLCGAAWQRGRLSSRFVALAITASADDRNKALIGLLDLLGAGFNPCCSGALRKEEAALSGRLFLYQPSSHCARTARLRL